MHGDAADVVTDFLTFASVQTTTHLDPERARSVDYRAGTLHTPGWPVEGGKEAITLGADLAASAAGNRQADSGIVAVEQIVPAPITQSRCLFGRAHNVVEKHCGEHAVRLGHGTRAGQELGDLLERGIGIRQPRQMIGASQLYHFCSDDAFSYIPSISNVDRGFFSSV